ncbi:copper-binding protein [Kosakonia sp. SMBL-WEM22]|uniref:copper-binding protein n=1 Tax=Kosakonia sp. SMBL-WEM22 TaxID=2725560 RepID=UPI001CB96FAC|nr:copper-binding protein [Kosakonia sp. SMBL-WEM22]
MRNYFLCLLSGTLLFPHLSAYAQPHDMAHHHAMPAQVYQSQGTVKKMTPQAITIAHQAIPALHWPPMTMQFTVTPEHPLAQVKVGDNVRFSFSQSEQGYTLIAITPLP